MHFALISKVLGLLLVVFSFTMMPPVAVSYFYQDGSEGPFLASFVISLLLGLMLWLPFFRHRAELQTRDGFLVVTLFWSVLGVIGGLPFLISADTPVGFTDAVFESVSGLTTTGASVLSGLDTLPKSILYYRQQLQWFGGMGVIVLAVAILPMLGIGGMQLYKAEIPGPMKDAKLTPRIAETAKALWYLYLFITVACASAYWLAGMTLFDAITHSFSTVATGGFSTHDQSMAYWDSAAIDWITTVFIIIGGTNFALHFAAIRGLSPLTFVRDPEFRFYIGMVFLYILLVTLGLLAFNVFQSADETLRHAAFQVASFSTGTGYTSTNAAAWPGFVPFLLVFTSFLGASAGSTGGGMKSVRGALVFHHSIRELRRLIYPNGAFALRFGRHTVNDRVLQAVWGFVGVYITIAVVFTLLFTVTGLDLATAVSCVAASLNNLGVGIGGVASGFADISPAAKWMMTLLMLLGRLEIFTLLVLFTPLFWKQ
ncbi:TrkH family potassium uptake protein [Alloalcanivorax xenomutans]|uniref:TrkH family potassium uptake protein n=1 Tax=Alloalcanivorax xenomutans TaxID=1094342 RepID=UPI003A811304